LPALASGAPDRRFLVECAAGAGASRTLAQHEDQSNLNARSVNDRLENEEN
jgi:hypothetical protein